MNNKVDKTNKTAFLQARVTEKKYEEVKKYSEDTGVSISALVALAVSEYMKKNKD